MTTIAPGPARSAIQSSAASGPAPTTTPLDPRRTRNQDRVVRDNENRQPVASGDAVDLILHRTGVGVDKDTQLRSGRAPHVGTWAKTDDAPIIGATETSKFNQYPCAPTCTTMSSLISPARSRPTSPAFPRAEQCRAFGLAAVAAELNLQIEMLEPEVAEAVAMGATALFLAGYGPRGIHSRSKRPI